MHVKAACVPLVVRVVIKQMFVRGGSDEPSPGSISLHINLTRGGGLPIKKKTANILIRNSAYQRCSTYTRSRQARVCVCVFDRRSGIDLSIHLGKEMFFFSLLPPYP